MSARGTICLVLGLALSGAALAQGQGLSRWNSGSVGLQPGKAGFQVPCGTVAFPCDQPAVRLYAGTVRDRPVGVDLHASRDLQPRLSVFGKLSRDSDFGVYGRFGGRSGASLMGANADLAYGVGVTWELTPNTSATVGWDSYDLRQGGAERELRAKSLGLQWRY
jgi:hypothetical protein